MPIKNRIVYGQPDVGDYCEGAQSLGELCIARLTIIGEKILMIDGISDKQLSGANVRDRGIRVAECLQWIGIRDNDTVGICCENRLEFASVVLGTAIRGACLTPMNPAYTDREIEHALNLTRPKIIFVSPTNAATFAVVTKQLSFVERLIVFDPIATAEKSIQLNDGDLWYSEFVSNAKVPPVWNGSAYKCKAQDMAKVVNVVLYSSGTTGLPKGVQLTQMNSIVGLSRFVRRDNAEERKLIPVTRALGIVPFFHTFGYHVCMLTMLFGDQLIILPRFEPITFLRTIEKYRCTNLYVAPPLMVFLAKSPLVDQYDISSAKIFLSGAAPLTAELQQAVYKRLKCPIIRQGYGMTEGTFNYTAQSDAFHSQGSNGELSMGMEGRVVHIETGELLGPNAEGELHFRGNEMFGYKGNPKATADMIGSDGWLRTGDIGYYTEKGEWYVVDRLKELIKYKGFQVAPAELEGLLIEMPQISDCGVIGVPDERAGELPFAFVVRQANAHVTEAEVEEYVRKRTAASKWLRGGVRFVAEIPKNASGKILRRELRTLAKALTVGGLKAKL